MGVSFVLIYVKSFDIDLKEGLVTYPTHRMRCMS